MFEVQLEFSFDHVPGDHRYCVGKSADTEDDQEDCEDLPIRIQLPHPWYPTVATVMTVMNTASRKL